MALDHNKISQFIRDLNDMVVQLGEFIAIPEHERSNQDQGEVRRLRVAAAALVGAADAIGRMPGPMPPMPPPPISPAPPTATPPAEPPARR